MLVTDAMRVVGTDEQAFEFEGEIIRLDAGRLTTPAGTLAGSALDMAAAVKNTVRHLDQPLDRSEEHTSELQSLMRISYAVFCLKKKKQHKQPNRSNHKL